MNPAYSKDNVILTLTFEFAVAITKYCDYLESIKKYNLAKQLFKSGTSIGANSREAQNAENKADFIHKFKIAAKEMDETEYWLLLSKSVYNHPERDELLKKLESISKIITKIISSSKNSQLANYHIS